MIRKIRPPSTQPSIAGVRAGKRRMSEHMDVRVRRGARTTRSAGHPAPTELGRDKSGGVFLLGTFLCTSKEKYLACGCENPQPRLRLSHAEL